MERIFFYVQSLLGRGHLVRAANLCRALSHEFEVLLIDGGGIVPEIKGIKRQSLPPIRSADTAFSELLGENGKAIDDSYKQKRKTQLLQAYHNFSPNIVIVESYPLARRAFAFELDPLLQQAGSDGVLRISSVRDILVFNGADKKRQAILQKLSNIDKIWVHGDEAFCPLQKSLPFANELQDKIIYSGYIGEKNEASPKGDNRIIVSGGGGAAAEKFYESLYGLAEKLPQYNWLFLLGENFTNKDFANKKLPHIEVAENVPDLQALLKGAKLSISQAGYNTVMDIVACGVPCLLQAFAGDGGESEQPLRASLLQASGRAEILPQDLSETSPDKLASLIDKISEQKFNEVIFDIASPQSLNAQLKILWRQYVG